MKLAIIILSGDTPDILFNCLRGIRANVLVEYKIYLAYNGKSPEIEAQIHHFFEAHFSANQYKIVKYDFYNFSVLNNDIVRSHLDPDTELLLFCNNDVVVMGECVNEMVYLMSSSPVPLGTIGCRLLFGNGKIQHDGQVIFLWRDGSFRDVTHINQGSMPDQIEYTEPRFVIGNTFALCLCQVQAFKLVGLLNESYKVCFEDVEINLKFLRNGYRNATIPSRFFSFHLESYSRERTPEKRGVIAPDVARLVNYFHSHFINGNELLRVTDALPVHSCATRTNLPEYR